MGLLLPNYNIQKGRFTKILLKLNSEYQPWSKRIKKKKEYYLNNQNKWKL